MRFSFIRFIAFFLFLSSACDLPTAKEIEPKGDLDNKIEEYQVDDSIKKEVIFNRKPKALKYWLYPPDITLCPGTGLTQSRFRQAVGYWERLGYSFQNVTIVYDRHNCIREPSNGEIMIGLFRNDTPIGNNLAVTQVYFYTATSEILSVRISMLPAHSNKPWVLEHEIGHALGWSHFSNRGHIMNSEYQSLGPGSSGMNYEQYQIEIKEIIDRQN